jgi:peptidoglycan/LPS O-acetylase OafA/YrhL
MRRLRGNFGDLSDPVKGFYASPRHRDDLQGLRAIAVLLVALNHAGVGFLPGGYVGVDVFFVLSGFLITQLLLAEAAKSGRVSLVNFYIRRARRILPAAALTLVATDVAAYLLLNPFRAYQTMKDSVWAALFGANINYARQATDYFAQGQPASPLLHFWSLSVEEQFYFFWPTVLSIVLLGTLAGVRLRRGGGRFTGAALGGLMVATLVAAAASFAYAHHLLRLNPAGAYFSSVARAWELALGAALAIGIRWMIRTPAAIRIAAGWVGLACIGVAAVAFSSSTPFPGKAALLPTVGAALVIASGVRERDERRQAGRLLGSRPLRYVGDRSYAFYLWHWPFLAIAADYKFRELPVRTNSLLLAAAFVLSIITYRYFENPIRRMNWKRPVGVLLWPVSAGVVLAVAYAGIGSIESSAAGVAAAGAGTQPAMVVGASGQHQPAALPAVIASVRAEHHGAPIPSPLAPNIMALDNDYTQVYPTGCLSWDGQTRSEICHLSGTTFTPSSAPTPGHKTLVEIGDSHASMWGTPLVAMANSDNWDVVPLVKFACTPAVLYADYGANWPECHTWYLWTLRTIKRLHPDTVFISFSDNDSRIPGDVAQKSESALASFTVWASRVAKHVVLMLDTPDFQGQLPEPVDCLQESGATLRTCTGTWSGASLDFSRRLQAFAALHHIGVIDPLGWFCYRGACPPVIGHTIAFHDYYGHVTNTYATALRIPFRAAFRAALHAP